MRRGAAFLTAEPAATAVTGSIASSSGKATAVPNPFKTVRREIPAFMLLVPLLASPHLEWFAFDHFDNQRGKLVVVPGQRRHDPVDGALVVGLHAAAKGIG